MQWAKPPREKVVEVVHLSCTLPTHMMPKAGPNNLTFVAVVITESGRKRTVNVRGKDEMDVYRRLLLEGI
jgi:hypothetical protein